MTPSACIYPAERVLQLTRGQEQPWLSERPLPVRCFGDVLRQEYILQLFIRKKSGTSRLYFPPFISILRTGKQSRIRIDQLLALGVHRCSSSSKANVSVLVSYGRRNMQHPEYFD
jgi:hypothetical protein